MACASPRAAWGSQMVTASRCWPATQRSTPSRTVAPLALGTGEAAAATAAIAAKRETYSFFIVARATPAWTRARI